MSPLARLFYVALWCEADREGRIEWKPGTFKMRYLPGDNCDVPTIANELIERGLIVLYLVEGKQYAEIPTFTEHQVINNRESESTHPPRDKNASRTRVPRVKAEGKGREGKEGKGKEPASAREDRFEDFWKAWPKSERKQDKAKCADKWKTQKLDQLADRILADIETKKRTQKWQGGFIEAPEVYLNNKRWEDGVTPDEQGQSGVSDPDSRSAIEAEGIAKGIGAWNEGMEQWHVYKAKVRGRTNPGLNISQLAAMAHRRAA